MLIKFRFLFVMYLVLLICACVLGKSREPNSKEVLEHYRESLSYCQSVSMKISVDINSFDVDKNNVRQFTKWRFPQEIDVIFNRDKGTDRAEWIGRQLLCGVDEKINLSSSRVVKMIAHGNKLVSLESNNAIGDDIYSRKSSKTIASRIMIYNSDQEESLENPNWGGPLWGKMCGNNFKGIANCLAYKLKMRSKKEKVNGVDCFVLEGASKYGKVTAWIAPEKGYNAMKWIFEKSSENLFNEIPLSDKWPTIESGTRTFIVKELHELKNDNKKIFVPKQAHFTNITNRRDGIKHVSEYEYQTSDIQLNPDFEAMGAFKIEFPDGIRVFYEEFPDVKYRWENGKPVEFERFQSTGECPSKKE